MCHYIIKDNKLFWVQEEFVVQDGRIIFTGNVKESQEKELLKANAE
jgi:hypothetical protein